LSSKPEHSIQLQDLEALVHTKEVLLSTSEQELVKACAAGERVAQKRVYELFSGKMLSICRRYAKDADHARDLMHDGFIKVFLNIQKFKGQSSLQTWITRIMINNSLSAIRKEVRKGIKIKIDDIALAQEEAPPLSISQRRGITAKMVFDKITELPLGYRTVFSLYVLDGFSHKDIAQELDISVGTSKSQLAKAKKMLVKLLSEIKS
jgi:RNA polymerase sigma-70 factor (ECF subfamily)